MFHPGYFMVQWFNLQLLVDAARLEFVPVNVISDELSYKIAYALTVPVPESLVFSGENPRTLSVTFNAYVEKKIVL